MFLISMSLSHRDPDADLAPDGLYAKLRSEDVDAA
jgi:hypothetical protein